MDTFIYSLIGLSTLAKQLNPVERVSDDINEFVMEGLFATITNANFDEEEFILRIKQSLKYREELKQRLISYQISLIEHDVISFSVATKEAMIAKALKVAIHQTQDEDIRSIRELILFGLKGLAAYLSHAQKLGYIDSNLYQEMHVFMASLIDDSLTLEMYIPLTLALGSVGVQAMALLDQANTQTFGHPQITSVNLGVGNRPGILITGHDLHDLKQLLEQTKDCGVDVYTHSEMLAAHYYPELKKYEHLKGNYGNAWHLQTKEFETFNGPIIFTTNCLVPPRSRHPQITSVNLGVGNRPGILITGHDLHDLKQLLEQTKDCGVDVYTHSEMLAAHYYPELKKYEHLKGNYGNAWHLQTKEFETFNGPIIFTTNCLVPPRSTSTYVNRVYTTGNTGHPDFKVIPILEDGRKDFSAVIEQALTCEAPKAIEEGELVGGFAHHQVMSLADSIIEAVKAGEIGHFVVMAGCDGRHKERQYYTEFAQSLPENAVIMTAGCAKYRYNKLELGTIKGIPRLLDAGQCNDSYSLAVIALQLKEAFGLDDINELPIIYNIAWYEQKAVIVLLALLSLGVKKIHLGPTLPAFLSPNIVDFLVKNFEIGGITSVEEDLLTFFA